MRLVGVAMVRDEADIVEAFVRTNLVLLDALYVMVHRARDGTREILQALYREGAQIRLMDVADEAFHQERYANLGIRAAFRDDRADFVFPLDADEFVRAGSRAALEAALAALPPGAAGALPWLNYVPTAQDRQDPHPLMRLERRFRLTPPSELRLDFCKVVVGRAFAARPDARVGEGAHAVFEGSCPLEVAPCEGVALCHFPVRSAEQLARKAILGWLALLSREAGIESTSTASHWRRLYAALKERGALADEDIKAFIAAYVDPDSRANELVADPLPHRVATLRHSGLARERPLLPALLERAEALARLAAGA